MALVAYSDSEASDSEPETPNTSQPLAPKPAQTDAKTSKTIVDRSNPRKIRVALPEIKPETSTDQDGEDGPARKKARIGGGGAFSGFNSFLPAPKRNAATAEKDKKTAPARKVFSLKTGATPGFDRAADAELRNEMAMGVDAAGPATADDDDGTIPKAGSLGTEKEHEDDTEDVAKKPETEVKLKGNPMMFKPLSVGRTSQKKKKLPPKAAPNDSARETTQASQPPKEQPAPKQNAAPPPAAPPKPKISLFSLSTGESTSASSAPGPQTQSSTYEPLVYTAPSDAPAAGPNPEPQDGGASSQSATGPAQTLDNIADDLNLSRAQRRQLFGRNGDPSKSRVLHFNTDTEYAANQELAHETDLAAAQHNPVRAIAPGKHTLQQLVHAASNQREALEESFAAGRRNKQEAGSKYGW
ncbi:mitotic checkpoint regulator, MAD2B-interacting-domain-containing protein [Aspergillus ambiguus]|uniref:PRCC domain-containing protein n=1 Tax=Aspergillus ambiguus TaxID=176160 RepID=UPI003CCC9092